ncbi:MAG TPA: hypothetical protein VK559_09950 [Ferruginibacter sp.]|nr:hypothetical protein [Ferruginibacter sp.]
MNSAGTDHFIVPPLEFYHCYLLIAHSRWAVFLFQRCFSHRQNMLRIIVCLASLVTVAKEALTQELVEFALLNGS